jgi:iron complex outermembrane recepter protein
MNRVGNGNTICTLLAVTLITSMIGTAPSEAWSAEKPAEQEAPELTMEAVKVEGQRIENVESVKKEFARRPGSNILIEEKQIVESRALSGRGTILDQRHLAP